MSPLPPNVYVNTPGTPRKIIAQQVSADPPAPTERNPDDPLFVDEAKADLPPLIAYFGTASATTWLEQRYRIWRGEGSTVTAPKIQGYLAANSFVFAWGNPICVKTKEAMKETAEEMFRWCKEHKKKLVWCCVDSEFAEVLAEGIDGVEWSTLSCIQEDVLCGSSPCCVEGFFLLLTPELHRS
jgi:hypothetical protein